MTQLTGAKHFGPRLAQERRLKAAREGRDIQRQDVARAVSVSNSTYGRWEDGDVMPRDDVMERLAAFFGVTPGWLRYGNEPRLAKAADPFGDGSDMGIPLAPGTAFDDEDEVPVKKRAAGGGASSAARGKKRS